MSATCISLPPSQTTTSVPPRHPEDSFNGSSFSCGLQGFQTKDQACVDFIGTALASLGDCVTISSHYTNFTQGACYLANVQIACLVGSQAVANNSNNNNSWPAVGIHMRFS